MNQVNRRILLLSLRSLSFSAPTRIWRVRMRVNIKKHHPSTPSEGYWRCSDSLDGFLDEAMQASPWNSPSMEDPNAYSGK